MKSTRWIVLIALVAAIVGAWWFSRPSADEVMRDFFEAKDRAEDMLMDPLILNADVVRSTVIAGVADRSMPKRRYAIGFLGNDGSVESLPCLRRIVEDSDEIDYFRADALSSIAQIDHSEATQLARKYVQRSDLLGRFAKEIVDGVHQPVVRTYWDALAGKHD